jgi:hypothetical protein
MSAPPHDKRQEPRRPAEGAVQIRFSNPQPEQIQGRLIDISASGFRMAHGHTSLEAGRFVEFTHADAAGHARVAWNRILEDRVETGFYVLRARDASPR